MKRNKADFRETFRREQIRKEAGRDDLMADEEFSAEKERKQASSG